jgi:hypothetical protein
MKNLLMGMKMNKDSIIKEIENLFNKRINFIQKEGNLFYIRIKNKGYVVYPNLKYATQNAKKTLIDDLKDNLTNLPNELFLDDKELIKIISNFLLKKHGWKKFLMPYEEKLIISKKGLYIKELGLQKEDMLDMYQNEE